MYGGAYNDLNFDPKEPYLEGLNLGILESGLLKKD